MNAPVASIGLSIMATPSAVVGYGVAMTVQQHAGTETTVRGPRPFSRRRIASAAPQPGHAECPENISSWAGMVSLAIDRHLLFDILPMDLGHGP